MDKQVKTLTTKVKADLESVVGEVMVFIKKHKKLIALSLIAYAAYKFLFGEDTDSDI